MGNFKSYSIEVILQYNTDNIKRDYTLCSATKAYDLEKILNKNIYEHVKNLISEEEPELKENLKKIHGTLRIPLESNYLDLKIIEQIINHRNESSEPSIYNLFINDVQRSESNETLDRLFTELKEDLKLNEKYELTKEYRSNIIKEINELPKGYNTNSKKKDILLEYGKYFNYFTNNTDIDTEYKQLESNINHVNKIITYYNIYYILKYLYLPEGTIINDIIYDINENKEIKQYFTINKILPILQKTDDFDFIKGDIIRVYFNIDYTIKNFNSYIELNINFYNTCEEIDILEKEEKDYNTIVFTKQLLPPPTDNEYLDDITFLKIHGTGDVPDKIIDAFSEKIGTNKEIKLNKEELKGLSMDYDKFKESINNKKIIKIKDNFYSFNYDKETLLVEDKYTKQLYEIYDASILDKKFNPTKIYFDEKINYEEIRSKYEILKASNDIFKNNIDKIDDLNDTFLIEETANYYSLNYKNASENADNILCDLFINYFYFKKNNDLLVDGKYYNIRNVEIISPKYMVADQEKSSNIYVKKNSNDIRLKHKDIDNIYQIYLYINYYKKEKKTDKVPFDAIITSGSNCIAKAGIIDTKIQKLLGYQYETKFFTKKLLSLLNSKDDDIKGDKDIDKLKSMGAEYGNSPDDEDINKFKSMDMKDDSEELGSLIKIDKAYDVDDKNLMKLKTLGGNNKIKGGNNKIKGGNNKIKGGNNKIKGGNNKIKGGNNKIKGGNKKYHKTKKNPRLKTKHSTLKLINDYLKCNFLFTL